MKTAVVVGAVFFSAFCLIGLAHAAEEMTFEQKIAVVVQIEDGDTFYLYFEEDSAKVKTFYRANLMGVDRRFFTLVFIFFYLVYSLEADGTKKFACGKEGLPPSFSTYW